LEGEGEVDGGYNEQERNDVIPARHLPEEKPHNDHEDEIVMPSCMT
jgi:hypothetical protein